MPIVPLLTSAGFFDPRATRILTAAFDTAWQMLKTSGSVLAADYQATSTRELLAKRIIETGRQGERNPLRLAEDALAHLANYQKGTIGSDLRRASISPLAPLANSRRILRLRDL